jgi:arylsulfatase A-like enzyme/Flp pilus assembly protein TadD
MTRLPHCWGALVALAIAAVAGGCQRQPPSAAGFNLVLVTLDTVRGDHLGAYGARDAQTPNLDRLAAEGVRFASATSPVPLTLPAHASILSGLLPPRHGLRNNGAGSFPGEPQLLATRLSSAGYRTGAFVGAFVLDRRFGLARGFEHYDDEIDALARTVAGLDAERPAPAVVDRALAWLEQADGRPFFAWVHLYDAHAPYEPPEPYRSRFAGRLYDGEIALVDTEVGRLLAHLEQHNLASKTVVAVVGDHGEALGEHGELTHGLLLYEGSLRVPLLLAAPGVLPSGWVIEEPVGLADIATTLAGLLGQPLSSTPERPLDGRDLSGALRARREPPSADLYAETRYPTTFMWSPLAALRRGNLKYVAAPRPELYDLSSDPEEQHNLLPAAAGRETELMAALAALASAEGPAAPAPKLDAEARARLESLGYLSGGGQPTDQAAGPRDPKDMVAAFRAFEEAHWALIGGRTDVALAAFETLVVSDPGNPVFVGQFAEACRRAGRLDRAVELYRQAVALAPSDSEARYNLAVTLQEAGRQEEAVTALTTAIWLDPGRPEAHNALGIALLQRGDLAGAREQFARTTELDRRNANAFNNLGNVLRELGRLDEAEQAYRQASKLAPDYADPCNGLGTLEVQRDRPAQAIPWFDRAIALAPGLHEARFNRAIALELSGNRTAAIAGYRDYLAATAGDRQFAQQQRAARQLLARLERSAPGSHGPS